MGLDNRAEGKFITILGGKFCQKVPEGTQGAVTRTNKLGKTVTEKFYDSFTGKPRQWRCIPPTTKLQQQFRNSIFKDATER